MRQIPNSDGTQSPFAETVVIEGLTILASGKVAFDEEQLDCPGNAMGRDPTTAGDAAALCAANILRAVGGEVGSLNRIACVSNITVYVSFDVDLAARHFITDRVFELIGIIFGENSNSPRAVSAIAQRPMNSSMEVELILQMANQVRVARSAGSKAMNIASKRSFIRT